MHAAGPCPPGSGLKALKLLATAAVVVCHGAALRQSAGRVPLRAPALAAVTGSEATLSASSLLLLLLPATLGCAGYRDVARLPAAMSAFQPASGTEPARPSRHGKEAVGGQGSELGTGG